MNVIVQLLGSLLILVPFVLVQLRRLSSEGTVFLVLNAVGSGILAIEAGATHQWGFVLLEGVWAVVSVVGLLRGRARASESQPKR